MAAEQSQPEGADVAAATTTRTVVKNTVYLTVSQALTVPLSVIANIVAARYLGPEVFGIAYLAATICSLGFLVVGWGHDGVLPAVVARDHSTAGTMLGSSLAFRVVVSLPVYALMALGCYLFGYGADLQWALLLTALIQLVSLLCATCKDTMRGLERADIPALAHVGQQLLATALVIPALLLGGKLSAALSMHIIAAVATFIALSIALPRAGVGKPKWSRDATKRLLQGGTPFVVSGLVMALQPNIDAVFVSKLAPGEVMGWYAVARRLVGLLLFPASALIGALYPTLCRLWAVDREGFARTTSGSLRGVSLLVVPVAFGSALYADFAIALFSREFFGPAAADLQVLSVFVFLVYFSMPLGTAVLAADKQRAWSAVQSLCLIASVALDPLLVPWFQRNYGNGGLGVCVASVVSELLVVLCGAILVPSGTFDAKFLRGLALALLGGAAMTAVALTTRWLTPFVAAPLSLLAYGAVLWLTGAIEPEQIEAARAALARRLGRFRSTSGG